MSFVIKYQHITRFRQLLAISLAPLPSPHLQSMMSLRMFWVSLELTISVYLLAVLSSLFLLHDDQKSNARQNAMVLNRAYRVPCYIGRCTCVVDCVVSDWALYSECSVPCGEGVAVRERRIIRNPDAGQAPCPTLLETGVCQLAPCPWCEYPNVDQKQ